MRKRSTPGHEGVTAIDDNPTPWHRVGCGENLGLQDPFDRAMGHGSVNRNHDRVRAMSKDPVRIMSRQNDQASLPGFGSKRIGQPQTFPRILMGQRFVKQQGIGITGQSECDPGPLTFPTRQSGPASIGKFSQSHREERSINPGTERADPGDTRSNRLIERLWHNRGQKGAVFGPCLSIEFGGTDSGPLEHAAHRRMQTRQCAQQGRFSSAIGTEHTPALTRAQGEIDRQ